MKQAVAHILQKNKRENRRASKPIAVNNGAKRPDIPHTKKNPGSETRRVYPKRNAAKHDPGISTAALKIVEVYKFLLKNRIWVSCMIKILKKN